MTGMDTAAVAAKLLLYATTFAAAGGAVFLLPFRRQLTDVERRGIARLSSGLAAVAIATSVLRVALLIVMLGNSVESLSDPFLLRIVLEGPEGLAAAVRIAGLALIPLTLCRTATADAIAGLGAAAATVSFAFTGHTSAAEPGMLAKLLLGIHLLGLAYWLGAFAPLRMLTYSGDLPRVAGVMKRFGDVAVFMVGGLVAAGLLLLWILLGSPLAIFESAYGRLVFGKLLLVSALLGLAALNKLRLTPRLLAGDPGALRSLRSSISTEVGVAVAILALTAAFTTVVGPPGLE